MNLTYDELDNYIKEIISLSRIKNKIVVLCEGNISDIKNPNRSPSALRKSQKKQDSSFYKACLPENIKNQRIPEPEFFNCGDRTNVLKAYFKLKELHLENKTYSHLDINKLFVIIDLDIQKENIDNYKYNDTEEIFNNLYTELKINTNKVDNHIIFTTGLIHKEAYFLLPKFEYILEHLPDLGFFNFDKNEFLYENQTLNLKQIYSDIIEEITEDNDLKNNFDIVCNRISFSELDFSNIDELKSSFVEKFNSNLDDKLIKTLFLVRKVKPYWEKISNINTENQIYTRDQL